MKKLVQKVEIANYGKFPELLDLGELEGFLNNSFGTRGMELVDGYFNKDSPNYPSDVSFLVLTRDEVQDGKPLAGILIAETKQVGGFNFDYYNKIAVHPYYRNNGVMKDLLQIARTIGDQDCQIPPSILRTSDPETSETYKTLSDKVVQIGDYHIHGFGFFRNGNALFDGAQEKFEFAANYVAALPKTIVNKPISTIY